MVFPICCYLCAVYFSLRTSSCLAGQEIKLYIETKIWGVKMLLFLTRILILSSHIREILSTANSRQVFFGLNCVYAIIIYITFSKYHASIFFLELHFSNIRHCKKYLNSFYKGHDFPSSNNSSYAGHIILLIVWERNKETKKERKKNLSGQATIICSSKVAKHFVCS